MTRRRHSVPPVNAKSQRDVEFHRRAAQSVRAATKGGDAGSNTYCGLRPQAFEKRGVAVLTTDQAKQFFGSLYDHSQAPDLSDFDAAAIRLVARVGRHALPGNKALGALMLNAVMSSPDADAETQAEMAAVVLMNIQAPAVEQFLERFPSTTLDDLIGQAREAGYEVDVLDGEVANRVPREVVGRGQLMV
jgi:hypothetical protein